MDLYKAKIIQLLLASIIVIVASAIIIMLWIYKFFMNSMLDLSNFYLEIFKLTYQFFVLALIGGGVSLLFSESARERERKAEEKSRELQKREEEKLREQEKRAATRELHRKFLDDFILEYNSAKRIRVLLRAEAKSPKAMIKVKPYREQMQALIHTHLQLQYLKKVVENSDLFLGARDLAIYLYSIEVYLNRVVREYEESYKLSSDDGLFLLEKLPYLKDFIIRTEKSKEFKPMFNEPANKTLDMMLKLLTKGDGKLIDSCDVDILVADLKDKDSSVRWRAAKALGEETMKDPKAVDHLILALQDESGYVRLRAVEALGKIKDNRAKEPLKLLKDDHYIIQKAVEKSLRKMEKESDSKEDRVQV